MYQETGRFSRLIQCANPLRLLAGCSARYAVFCWGEHRDARHLFADYGQREYHSDDEAWSLYPVDCLAGSRGKRRFLGSLVYEGGYLSSATKLLSEKF